MRSPRRPRRLFIAVLDELRPTAPPGDGIILSKGDSIGGEELMRTILIAIGVLVATLAAAQDKVVLKTGDVLEGKILKKTEKGIVLKTKYGTLEIPTADIKKITGAKTIESDYAERRKEVAAALFRLALWCEKNGMKKEAERALKDVIRYDPDHARARAKLGFVKKGKRWVRKKGSEPKPKPERKEPMTREQWRSLQTEAVNHLMAERFKKALEVCEKILKAYPEDYYALYTKACALARLGRKKPALETLRKAVLAGFPDRDRIKEDPDLASLREEPEFEKILRLKPEKEKKESSAPDESRKEAPKRRKVKFF